MTQQVDGQSGLVTAAEYARLRGVSKQAASKWPLVKVPDPNRPGMHLVDVAATDAKRGVEQNPLKRQAPIEVAPAEDEPRAPQSPTLVPDEIQTQGRSARVEREHWAAKNERLNYEQRVGRLIDRRAAEHAQTETAKATRARLASVGARVAQRASELSDPRAIRALIDDEIRKALTASADDLDDLAATIEAEAASEPETTDEPADA
ncbi:hypothetical protein [Chenggangzhangella methanolivorans]|uniref:Terminase small subunit n=1 Tax=Chenggangzhangella methanolivorans TaxID=1437009 RepID=A0A9E6RF35_9HYPH|nr:hypothetical protein [Chenggangzhangella methanolivorans]QZN99781.1 hypothetical protein K6K41_24480 [Chenggangzhangella methanolivorans]